MAEAKSPFLYMLHITVRRKTVLVALFLETVRLLDAALDRLLVNLLDDHFTAVCILAHCCLYWERGHENAHSSIP